MRPCTWCVFPHGESSPLRRCLGSCAEVCLQKALYTEGLKYNVLAATKQLYESFSPSVCLSVTPFQQCCHHRIVMKFSGVITIDRSDVCAKKKKQDLMSKVKVTEVATQFSRFRTINQAKIQIWRWNDAQRLMRQFWPELGVSGL